MVVKRTAVSTKLSLKNFAFLDKQRRFFRPYDISMSSLVNLCVRVVRQLHARGELSLEPLQLQAQLSLDLGKFIEAKQRERVTAPKHVSSRGPKSSPMTKRQRVQRLLKLRTWTNKNARFCGQPLWRMKR